MKPLPARMTYLPLRNCTSMVCHLPSLGAGETYPMKYCRLSSSAMPDVAGSRSRGETTISVRPPLSSVIARSASGFTRSTELDPLRREEDGGGGGGGVGLGADA